MSKIFISYRRQHFRPVATLIYDPLAQGMPTGMTGDMPSADKTIAATCRMGNALRNCLTAQLMLVTVRS